MKKIFLFLLLVGTIYYLPFIIPPVHAQDAPNTNVTKRRPDRSPNYSPSPASVGVDSRVDPTILEVKQSFFSQLWSKISQFFQKIAS